MKVPKTVQNNQKFLTALLTASGSKAVQQQLNQASLPQLKLLVKLIGEVITKKIPLSDEKSDKRRIAPKKDYLRQIYESAHIIRGKQQKDKSVVCNLFTPILNLISVFVRAVVTHFALNAASDAVDNALTTTALPPKIAHTCCPCMKTPSAPKAAPVAVTEEPVPPEPASKPALRPSCSSSAATDLGAKAPGNKRPADTSSDPPPFHKKKAMGVKPRDKSSILEELLQRGSSPMLDKNPEVVAEEDEKEGSDSEEQCDFC